MIEPIFSKFDARNTELETRTDRNVRNNIQESPAIIFNLVKVK